MLEIVNPIPNIIPHNNDIFIQKNCHYHYRYNCYQYKYYCCQQHTKKREIPQMPCPLVQPLLMLVPTPTSSPPIIKVGKDAVMKKGISFFEKTNRLKALKLIN